MNNNQNNGTTIILLLIILMISSSMSSVGAVLGFNLFTSVGPSRETKSYIGEKDKRIERLSLSINEISKWQLDDIIRRLTRAYKEKL